MEYFGKKEDLSFVEKKGFKYIRLVKRKRLLAQLEELASKLDIQIRREKLGQARGGLCRIEERFVIIINKDLSDSSQIELLSQELARFDTNEMYLLPEVRESLERKKKDE